MNRCRSVIALALMLGAANAPAAPTGAELLAVCESALETNFSGLRGKMCTWYVTPCDCNTTPGIPRVCLTDPIDRAKLAFTVTEMMKAVPDYQTRSAEEAVALILSEIYPCDS